MYFNRNNTRGGRHALDRYREHHRDASDEDMWAALRYSTRLDPDLLAALTRRVNRGPHDTYWMAPDKQGVFTVVVNKDENYQSLRTYIRLSLSAQKIMENPPTSKTQKSQRFYDRLTNIEQVRLADTRRRAAVKLTRAMGVWAGRLILDTDKNSYQDLLEMLRVVITSDDYEADRPSKLTWKVNGRLLRAEFQSEGKPATKIFWVQNV